MMVHLCRLNRHEWHYRYDRRDCRYCLWCDKTQIRVSSDLSWVTLPGNGGFEDGECADEYCDHDGVCCGHRDGACDSRLAAIEAVPS